MKPSIWEKRKEKKGKKRKKEKKKKGKKRERKKERKRKKKRKRKRRSAQIAPLANLNDFSPVSGKRTERRSLGPSLSNYLIWLFEIGSIIFWEVGVVILRTLNMALILTSKRNIRNIRNLRPPTLVPQTQSACG